MNQWLRVIGLLGIIGSVSAPVHSAEQASPATGYDIHVQVPHMMPDGTVGGPFHHYCKGISDQILQCLLFESTDPKAKLVAVEYFVAKDLARKLPAIQWHRHFHDHQAEIATGRLQVLDVPEEQAKKVAEAAAKTDGVIYHLWQHGKEFPDGTVTFPQAISHPFPGLTSTK
ncbi:MAG: DUF1264 domain-containing protein [Nitrospira sp.]|jgi:hypothetical protein|nr:DUF1264 domain-containing protein [Nitrospira sp.]MDI3465930.1 hypothetical protein [Nitrospira sp.]